MAKGKYMYVQLRCNHFPNCIFDPRLVESTDTEPMRYGGLMVYGTPVPRQPKRPMASHFKSNRINLAYMITKYTSESIVLCQEYILPLWQAVTLAA